MTSSGLAAAVPGGARRAARPWIELLARVGYAARGVLYVTIGALSVMLALGESGGQATDSRGALRALGEQPFGKVLLIAMALGLTGHAIWRFVQSTLDPEGEARSAGSPVIKRIAFFVSGALHAALAVFAVRLAVGAPAGREEGAKALSARVMSWDPLGVWIVAAAGVIVVVFGIAQIRKVWRDEVGDDLATRTLSRRTERWIVRFGAFGTAARGGVIALAGLFVVIAALRFDPREAKGLADTLGWLRGQTLGDVALGVVAVGLVAYGLYQFVIARYRVIHAA